MRSSNPIYIPRNYLVEEALENFTTNQDDVLFDQMLQRMRTPYQYDEKDRLLQEPPPHGDAHYHTFCNT